MIEIKTKQLDIHDRDSARALFMLMTAVFGEAPGVALSDGYLDRLLSKDDFWVIAAFIGNDIVGGVTGHTLAMTRSETSEVFIYDLAVHERHQRKGVGRQLIAHLRQAAHAVGIDVLFVPADNEDIHALDFYRAIGGDASPVTFFTL